MAIFVAFLYFFVHLLHAVYQIFVFFISLCHFLNLLYHFLDVLAHLVARTLLILFIHRMPNSSLQSTEDYPLNIFPYFELCFYLHLVILLLNGLVNFILLALSKVIHI